MNYTEFLQTKIDVAKETGFELPENEINPALMSHQRDAVGYLQAEENEVTAPTLLDFLG